MLINTYTLEVKKSKFIAYYYEVKDIEEINFILNNLKIEHKKAKHFPYAYKIDNLVKKSDDKEPNNTAGLPLYNLIIFNNLNNTLLVVVRYFGGTKLGAGLLLRTYKNTAMNAINKQKNT